MFSVQIWVPYDFSYLNLQNKKDLRKSKKRELSDSPPSWVLTQKKNLEMSY